MLQLLNCCEKTASCREVFQFGHLVLAAQWRSYLESKGAKKSSFSKAVAMLGHRAVATHHPVVEDIAPCRP